MGTQIKLGWQVDYWPVGHLVETMDAVTEAEVDAQMEQYKERYDFATDDLATVRYQAREEVAMRKILEREGPRPLSTTSRTSTAWSSCRALPART